MTAPSHRASRPGCLAVTLVIVTALVALVARPRRHEIDGLSMAPALMPGDIVSSGWFPQLDPLIGPGRFDRWLLAAPDDMPVIKRVVGLPGESVSLHDGDLAIDGGLLLTPPGVLAEVASSVSAHGSTRGPWQRSFSPSTVFDDADFAPDESRRLLPVRDVGLAVMIDTTMLPLLTAVIRVGSRAIRWPLPPGRFGLVAGRLDGHLVAAAWCLGRSPTTTSRSPLPPDPPAGWQIVEPWQGSAVEATALPLALRLECEGIPLDRPRADRCLERCVMWRDMLHRPPPDGTTSWHVGPDEIFVLGDFPAASRDSRHWGPLPAGALHHALEDRSPRLSARP